MPSNPDIPAVYAAMDTYLTMLRRRSSAEVMMARIVTDDFATGLRGGDMWCGPDGLSEYLSGLAEFFDRRDDLKAVLSLTTLSEDEFEVTSRLEFFMRRWRPPSPTSDEFAGTAFHTWRLRLIGGELRIAAQIVDGFANLNDNARRLIASPVLGADIEESRRVVPEPVAWVCVKLSPGKGELRVFEFST